MKQVEDLRLAYQKIVSTYRGPTRIYMLQSIKKRLQELQQLSKNEETQANKTKLQITQTNDTSSSHLSLNSNCNSADTFAQQILSSSIINSDQLLQLQARIIEKQKVKFELNENIQTLEDQYLRLQQLIYKKREKTRQLQKQIANKTFEISKISREDVEEVAPPPSLGKKIMNFFIF